jgi:hypothetical protein
VPGDGAQVAEVGQVAQPPVPAAGGVGGGAQVGVAVEADDDVAGAGVGVHDAVGQRRRHARGVAAAGRRGAAGAVVCAGDGPHGDRHRRVAGDVVDVVDVIEQVGAGGLGGLGVVGVVTLVGLRHGRVAPAPGRPCSHQPMAAVPRSGVAREPGRQPNGAQQAPLRVAGARDLVGPVGRPLGGCWVPVV